MFVPIFAIPNIVITKAELKTHFHDSYFRSSEQYKFPQNRKTCQKPAENDDKFDNTSVLFFTFRNSCAVMLTSF